MLQILMGAEIPIKKPDLGFASRLEGWGSVSCLPGGTGSLTACPIPVLLHVQLVSQQEHGAAALAALRVQGEHLEVALAALEALPVVDAVDNKEGAGPAQVALAVPGAVLGVRGVAELQSGRGPAMAQLVITPPMPHLVSSVHHLQEHRLLVHQLLRGVGVLCKKKRRVVVRMGWHILSSSKPSKAQDVWDTMEKFQP